MKVTTKVTKEVIIKALKTEPLRKGQFFCTLGDSSPEAFAMCDVCAVGAVLRLTFTPEVLSLFRDVGIGSQVTRSNMTPEGAKSGETTARYVKRLLAKKNYLGALSVTFEALKINPAHGVGEKHRKSLISFVKKNFPKEITISFKKY